MQFDVLLSLLIIFIPLGTGIFLFLIPKRLKWVREMFALLATALAFTGAIRLFLIGGIDFKFHLIDLGNFSLDFLMKTDALRSFMLLFATGFGFFITIYSLKFMSKKDRVKEYYIFLLITVGCASGVFLSDHLFIFLIFWEMVSISLYFLITSGGPLSREGATKTMVMIGASDGCILIGFGMLWFMSRSLSLSAINVQVHGLGSTLSYLFILVGALTKAGAMPFHTWIPSASENAPAPVMALLPASIDKLLGIYLLLILSTRLFTITGALALVLMIIGAVTIIAAVMMALVQHNLNRLLAYHAISQVGYMVMGIGTMVPIGIIGGIFHMLNHSIYKSCLFLGAGAIEHKTGMKNELKDLGGLARTMPVTFITFLIAALSISGIPPFNGFVSKWMIYQGTIEGGNPAATIFLITAMFGSALTLASFIKALYSVFLGRKSKITEKIKKDVGITMQIPMIVLALLCIAFGLFFYFPLNNFILPGLGFAGSGVFTISGFWDSPMATILILLSLIIGGIIYAAGRTKKLSRVGQTFVGGEILESEIIRVPGTTFYNTIKSIMPFKKIYEKQEKGWFDPFEWFGRIGSFFTNVLRYIHNGLLPFYLAWSVLGVGALLLILYLF